MNQRARQFIRYILYAAGANLTRILTTFALTLLLPKFMTEENYGNWQLYLFYCSFLGYFSLGWCEGALLKYGGAAYADLDGRTMASQFWSLTVHVTLLIAAAFLISAAVMQDPQKRTAMWLALIFIGPQILKTYLQLILQATNRISDYARSFTWERLINFALVALCMLLGLRDFRCVAGMEIISVGAVLIYLAVLCREVTFRRPLPLRQSFPLTRELVHTGVQIMLASLAGQLIVGIVRFAIEEHWGTIVFGKISLSLSMANMLITCISAVSVVLYPTLRRSSGETLAEIYRPARTCLTAAMYGLLLFYVPGKELLRLWLPRYEESLRYLAILFPLCIYEARTSVLALTYLKTLRREKDIMRANIAVVLVSLPATYCTVGLLGSLDLAVLSIIVLYALKAIYTETLLARQMPMHLAWDHGLEGALTAVFILCSWLLPNGMAILAYLAAYGLYLCVKRKDVLQSAAFLRGLLGKEGKEA